MRDKQRQPPREAALPYAVKLLASRSYSTRKLREKLQTKGYLVEEIDAAIEKLKDRRLLDDKRFAEGFLRTRIETHPRGKNALVRDLISRGIAGNTAKEAVSQSLSNEQELKLAKELVDRKRGQYDKFDLQTRKRRLVALLARRGFRPDTIFKALALPSDETLTEEAY